MYILNVWLHFSDALDSSGIRKFLQIPHFWGINMLATLFPNLVNFALNNQHKMSKLLHFLLSYKLTIIRSSVAINIKF